MIDSDDCDDTFRYSMMITSAPSILGGIFVLFSFFHIPKIRTSSFFLILALSLSDSLFSVAWLFPVPEDRTALCRLQGWWNQFFPVVSAYISLLMAAHIYLLITKAKFDHIQHNTLYKLAALAVTVALIGSFIPFFTDQYGLIGINCWIATDEDGRDKQVGIAFRFGLLYAQILIISVVNLVIYSKTFRHARKLVKNLTDSRRNAPSESSSEAPCPDPSESIEDKVMQVVLRLQWYPVIMLASWFGLIVLRIYHFSSRSLPCWVMTFALNIVNLQGFWYSIIFFSNKIVREEWRQLAGVGIDGQDSQQNYLWRSSGSGLGMSSFSTNNSLLNRSMMYSNDT